MTEKRNGFGGEQTEQSGNRPVDAMVASRRTGDPAVPMDEYREAVIECIRANQNAVVIGETGSGKTTRIPDFLLDAFPQARVAITQPRRVAARSVANYVAKRRGIKVGGEIGYQVRFEDKTTEGTRANFMTDGILLRKLHFDPLLEEYDIVMVDEAHERSLNIDFALGLLKRVQAERKRAGKKELKVIAASATIEKEKFAKYFGESPVMEVPGRMYPVDVQYASERVYDYPKAAAERVRSIVASGEQGDVLIFMPGEEEIRKTIAEIEALKVEGIVAMPLFGAMAPEDQDKIFEKSPKRKVIVSTNIAETSVTIDGVRFVVDSGLIKQKEFNPTTGIEALLTKSHAKSGCEQRKGRAGRTASGTCYRLYTEKEYSERSAFQTPEIARSNLDHVILAMKKIGIEDVRGFDFIDPPEEEAVAQAIKTLKMLGALDAEEHLTETGDVLAELPLRPEIGRMVMEAEKYGCVGSVLTIAAMFGDKSVFVRPKEKADQADAVHDQFKRSGSDFLALLEVWNQWSASGFNETWARERFLNIRQLFEVREIRSQLMRELKRHGISAIDKKSDPESVQKSIAAGLIQHLMIPRGRFGYARAVNGNGGEVFIHPSSAAFSRKPEYMIGAEVVTTSKTFARKCQAINPKWLMEIAPQLLEEAGKSVTYDPKTDMVVERVSYRLKGQHDSVAERERPATDEGLIQEHFMRALIEGNVDLPSVKHNTEVLKELQKLRMRTGGMVQIPDLSAWYKKQAGGAKNRQEASYIDDQLRINIEEYYPPELRATIDRQYPVSIMLGDRAIMVQYDYRAGNPTAYWENEKAEKFDAILTIPQEILFKISESDMPPIGEAGRPTLTYKATDGWDTATAKSLEALQEAVDKKRQQKAWYEFSKPASREMDAVALGTLPPLESVGARPIPYAKGFRGEDVFAYPAYYSIERWDSGARAYQYAYGIKYVWAKEEAEQSTKQAEDVKTREDGKLRARMERDTLLAPARERQAALQSTVQEFGRQYSSYGVDYGDWYKIDESWRRIGQIIGSPDGDMREALTKMDEVETAVAKGKVERDRRLALIPETRTRMEQLAVQVSKITHETYQRFGLTYDQYSAISSRWREAGEALKTESWSGASVMPDPEKATILLAELSGMIPEEHVFTPEQEALAQVLSGRNASYAKIVRVRGGKVVESFTPSYASDRILDPEEISIGGSGRALTVHGSRLAFVFGSGREGASWRLPDGDFLFSRNADMVINVEEKPGAPYGWRALGFVEGTSETGETSPEPSRVVSASPQFLDEQRFGGGAFSQLGSLLGRSERKEIKTESPQPVESRAVPEEIKSVEREKMTEELRAALLGDLSYATTVVEVVRSMSESRRGDSDKIAKVKTKARELARDIESVEKEVQGTEDAARARGKVSEMVRRSEKVGDEIAKLREVSEAWARRYRTYQARLEEVAKAQEIDLTAEMLDKVKPQVAELAQTEGVPEDLDGALEAIIVDAI